MNKSHIQHSYHIIKIIWRIRATIISLSSSESYLATGHCLKIFTKRINGPGFFIEHFQQWIQKNVIPFKSSWNLLKLDEFLTRMFCGTAEYFQNRSILKTPKLGSILKYAPITIWYFCIWRNILTLKHFDCWLIIVQIISHFLLKINLMKANM